MIDDLRAESVMHTEDVHCHRVTTQLQLINIIIIIILIKCLSCSNGLQNNDTDQFLVASSLLCDSILVEIKCINVRRNTTVFSNCWRKQLHVWALSGWAIIRLRLEYRRKLIYCDVDIKNGGTRSRFTMFGEVCSYIYAMWKIPLRVYTHLYT
jgi:hypothetical protein